MTVQQILTRAYSHSTKNSPGRVVTESTEGFDIVLETVRRLFQVAARVNREYFGAQDVVAATAGGWDAPSAAESIYRYEIGSGARDGTKVVRVAMEDRQSEFRKPSVYLFGRKYFPAMSDAAKTAQGIPASGFDPASSESLRFFFARQPVDPTGMDDPLDPSFPERFRELLALEVAIYISMKDGRPEELPGLKEERDRWLAGYIAHLEHHDVGEHRRFDHDRRFNAPGMVPLQSLVAGGTALNLG